MTQIPVLDRDAVLAAGSALAGGAAGCLAPVSPVGAIDRVREAFLLHHRGEWTMPSKVYLPSPPHGDFRAMPALGDGPAMLEWTSSFPPTPGAHGLPAVMGVLLLSDAATSEPVAVMDA